MQRATRLELAAFSHENIALHRPSHLHRFRPDLTAYARVLPDRERSGGIDCALHVAVDEQLVQEFDRAFDRNSSGKNSARLRWHERAVGWSWNDRWVWLIRLRGFGAPARRKAAKSVHGRALCRIIRHLGSGIVLGAAHPVSARIWWAASSDYALPDD